MNSLSILITSVLNSASDRLLISISFIFFLEFYSVFSFGPYFFVSLFWQPSCVCFCVLGRAALIPLVVCPIVAKHTCSVRGGALCNLRGRVTHVTVALCGGGLREGTVLLPGLWSFAHEEAVSWHLPCC